MKSITRALEKEVLRTGRTEEGGVISSEIDGDFFMTLWYIKRLEDLGPNSLQINIVNSQENYYGECVPKNTFSSLLTIFFGKG